MMDRGKFKINLENGKISLNPANLNQVKKENPVKGNVEIDENKLRFVPTNDFLVFDIFFDKMYRTVIKMGLTNKNTNTIFDMCGELVNNYDQLCYKFEQEEHLSSNAERKALVHVSKQIDTVKSAYKRLRDFQNNPNFVEPIEFALGLKWKTKQSAANDIPDHKMISSTCHIVPVSKTLISLFSNETFRENYMEYNLKDKHKCIDGIYEDFCCGSTYKKRPIFEDKSVVQIQIGIDDFEPCCAIKGKAVKHKICGVYFQIRNLPLEISSKMDNIFLLGLCDSSDLKDDSKINEFVGIVVEELLSLESEGFNVAPNFNIKAVLVNVSCDNLGANHLFGFSKGFNAEYYCRVCELTRAECQQTTIELAEKIRTLTLHDECINIIERNPDVQLKDNKGVRMQCQFNKLHNFNIFENLSLDIMHDVHEGVLHVFLYQFFHYLIKHKIETEQSIVRKVRDFKYGFLHSKYKPSLLRLNSHTLGQNANQTYCLMIHLPLIFFDKKNKLAELWPLIEMLLQCLQIIMSTKISEYNVERFEIISEKFLFGMKDKFGIHLTPKMHLFTHYANAIRKMGPLKLMWMMRFESKHQFFTDIAKSLRNFTNVTGTMAL